MHRHIAAFAAALLITSPVMGQEKSNPKGDFYAWLQNIREEALQRGIRPEVVAEALADVKPSRRVIKRDRNQSEFKLTLSTYLGRVVTPLNIKVGAGKARKHRLLLDAVAKNYGVQGRFILAIWGIETRYGAVKADVPLISSLATLAYDARRSKFFKRQLFSTLQMVNQGHIDVKSLFGSWAGAMGQPQFMPSSYLAFAQDFDGDGRRDIWKNEGDVFASIANYLAKHRWTDKQTWGRKVEIPSGLVKSFGKPTRRAAPGCRAKTYPRKTLSEWQELGVRRLGSRDLPARDLKAALVLPDGPNGKDAYLVYSNYSAIMAYNCAHLYAVTVGTLSDRIQRELRK